MARRRTSMGRQKIEIRRIESEEARQVCFSKRRAGLFKKASELAILCGAEVAAVVFSPAGKAFSFGHPSVEAIIERFAPTGAAAGGGGGGGEDNKQLAELNRQYGELRAQLDAEKARKDRVEAAMAKERVAESPVAAWLEADIRDMAEEELMAFAAALQDVQAAVAVRANQVLQDALNHGRAMAARKASRMVPLPAPQQQLLGMGAGGNNGGFEVSASNSSGINDNGAGMDMQLQQMIMAMPPPTPGFAGPGLETMTMMQQGFGFLGPY